MLIKGSSECCLTHCHGSATKTGQVFCWLQLFSKPSCAELALCSQGSHRARNVLRLDKIIRINKRSLCVKDVREGWRSSPWALKNPGSDSQVLPTEQRDFLGYKKFIRDESRHRAQMGGRGVVLQNQV